MKYERVVIQIQQHQIQFKEHTLKWVHNVLYYTLSHTHTHDIFKQMIRNTNLCTFGLQQQDVCTDCMRSRMGFVFVCPFVCKCHICFMFMCTCYSSCIFATDYTGPMAQLDISLQKENFHFQICCTHDLYYRMLIEGFNICMFQLPASRYQLISSLYSL